MTKWEYKEILKKDINESVEKKLGAEGWELTTVSPNDAHTDLNIYIFKRPIEIEKTHDCYGRDGR